MAQPQAKSWNWRPASIWLLYAVGFVPAAWYFYLGATGQIPGNAVKVFEHLLGIWALRFLLATLAVTPLRDLAGFNLIRYRRALGLLAFWYVVMHFLTYMILDQNLNLSEIVKDIAERPFITIGMAALVMLVPLALTSNSWSIRRLGQRWNKLHKLSYVIVLAGATHYAMSVKVVTFEPFIYLVLAFLLVAYRPLRPRIMQWRKERRVSLSEAANR
ncbi:protein-methionine-sulfoxide reductase heme-binding subunit MsrQ [Mesorhizobium microcysteis]|uniref:Protein-methionine-sulfoxide reductase heme-binding subunit MsrQ n=1 Tax=Neoaquamicrobium microcysteis TaxID=2682781 RepID=A0A5D4GSF0_9HYPH|nr:protein-methionine-sulfoxide reductase heme-binding subunit MsrQ [Mesorhizobium microcysteis]TYR30833.1 protein-methionine-sulfoxide reductase heme-binding subunit MsrQ [Mesorhizobium microcysteis]